MSAQEMRNNPAAWLEARRYRKGVGYCIGSSDVSAILGVKDGGNPVELWHTKVNKVSTPTNAAMTWGHLHEPTVANYWRDRNRAVTRAVGLISSIREPWNQTSLDRLVLECPLTRGSSGLTAEEQQRLLVLRAAAMTGSPYADHASGLVLTPEQVKQEAAELEARHGPERCALEVKTADAHAARRWHATIPDRHFVQMIHQIVVSGLDHVHYAALIGGNDYRQGIVRRDEEQESIAYVMRRVRAFRAAHLAGKCQEVRPDWDAGAHAAKLLELDTLMHPERTSTADLDSIGDVIELAAVRRRLSDFVKQEKALKALIAERSAGARYLTTETDEGSKLVAEYGPVHRSKVDFDRMREKYPEVYADPEVVTHSKSWALKIAKDFQIKSSPSED